ncbi:DUF3866 family protein [Brevibacillus parabrevis]|uniref:DUF3866 family protein n=1 Tax=Brevibacillus parabrevis TaxID=54914 RepID=UPI0023809126|nr:DUF3866 family protein [Brevibacillus parabrevis]WDV97593.1 DUF3866 family protein [Brevibacillus parabrevis]
MLHLATGTVIRVLERQTGMQVLEVKLSRQEAGNLQTQKAISFAREEYSPGDNLLLNTTALQLQLGTGGFHLVVGKSAGEVDSDVAPSEWGHIMKMRYSPWQLAVDAVEEQASPFHELFLQADLTLEGTPVLIGELHSLLPPAVLALKEKHPQLRIVYVMPDAASLPIAFSQHVRQLSRAGHLTATVTTGHAWGGNREAVTIHSGLLAARHVEKADVILCMLGPGVAGTGTAYGFSGVQLAEVIHAVSALGGTPFFIPRISFADQRSRHYGISHHTTAILGRFALAPTIVTLPVLGDERDCLIEQQAQAIVNSSAKHVLVRGKAPASERLKSLEQRHGLSFSTMGRSWEVDCVPFQTAVLAADMLGKSMQSGKLAANGEPRLPVSSGTLEALGLYLTKNEEQP